MFLSELLSDYSEPFVFKFASRWKSLPIESVTHEVDKVTQGSLFVAIKGTQFDGHNHLSSAVQKGAVALLVEHTSLVPNGFLGPVIVAPSSRQALAYVAHRYYGEISDKILLFGVTGTNGKTSVTAILSHLLNEWGLPTARLGTLGHFFKDKEYPTVNTTPGPLELNKRLFEFYEQGAKAVVMEVSSHALDQCRVDGLYFDAVVFTNLSHDHLDYHHNMEKYFKAKSRLFNEFLFRSRHKTPLAILNQDDPWVSQLPIQAGSKVFSFGQSASSTLQYSLDQMSWEGSQFYLFSGYQKIEGSIPLVGEHNVQNFLAAAGVLLKLGVTLEESLRLMKNFAGVPGRLQKVVAFSRKNVHVFVDYAHTPDALFKVMDILKNQSAQLEDKNPFNFWVVFGCGGERDKTKRPLMGQVAQGLADKIILTSDNPRSEDPKKIIHDIEEGISSSHLYEVEIDREQAIYKALYQAQENDVILIAGKGHETYQQIGTNYLPFSDYEVAKKILEEL